MSYWHVRFKYVHNGSMIKWSVRGRSKQYRLLPIVRHTANVTREGVTDKA